MGLEPCEPWVAFDADADVEDDDPVTCCKGLDLTVAETRVIYARWLRVATSLLYRLAWRASGGMAISGVCEADELLCRHRAPCGGYSWSWCGADHRIPAGWLGGPARGAGDSWVNCSPCQGTQGCDCGTPERILLPFGPVQAVSAVTVNGVELAEDTWTLGPGGTLVNCGGTWPTCTDRCVDEGFRVAWTYGVPVPPDAAAAAAAFACELAKACIPSAACALPQRVTTVVRSGVTWTLLDPMSFLDKGRTGIYLVDAFLASQEGGATNVLFAESVEPINFDERTRTAW